MAADGAALGTFLLLVFVGPVGYAVYYAVKRCLRAASSSSSSSTTKAAAPAPASSSLDDYANGASAEPAREQVGTAEYMLGLLGYAIGIGNLWRFPYLVGKYGGGAFVLAYLTCLFLVAMPMYQMEMVLGHHTRGSTVKCFNTIRPRWRSIGYAQALMLFYALAYYNVLIAYAAIYMMGSLVSPLPWSDEAVDPAAAAAVNKSASEYYWSHEVLNEYESLEGRGLGPVQPQLAGSLLCVWLVVFVSLVFGKQILAKITWVTVVGPVFLLLVLLVQTTRLEGASDGVAYYIGKFDWGQLRDAELWATACGQILFSLSPGMGTAITMSSYTAPKEDTYRVCLIVALSNSAFSLTGGFAIFSILGNLAHRTGRTVADVASASGPGLAFVSIAEGVGTFGAGANAMAVLFFAMLVSLGLDSTFAWAETFVCYLDDFFLSVGRPRPKWQLVAAASALLFLVGLPFCTRAGLVLLDVTDRYGVSYYLLGGCFLEVVMFHCDFGWERLAAHVKQATAGNRATPKGRRFWPPLFWKATLYVTAPGFTSLLFLQLWWQDLSAAYGGYPGGYQAYGWCLLMALMILTPLTMVKLDTTPGTLPPSGALGGGPRSSGAGLDDGTSGSDNLLRRTWVLLAGRMPVALLGGRAQTNQGGSGSSCRGSAHCRSPSAGSERALELSTVHQGTPDI